MIKLEELSELIKTRRSIRKFQDKPVQEELLMKALELATWAPNGGNKQVWRFLIVTNRELIQKMGDAVKSKTELMASWPEAGQFGETVAKWRRTSDFFRGAPVCIAVLMGRYSSVAGHRLHLSPPALLRAGNHLDGRALAGQEGDRTAPGCASRMGFCRPDSHGVCCGSPGGAAAETDRGCDSVFPVIVPTGYEIRRGRFTNRPLHCDMGIRMAAASASVCPCELSGSSQRNVACFLRKCASIG
jgi:hypothetical protein